MMGVIAADPTQKDGLAELATSARASLEKATFSRPGEYGPPGGSWRTAREWGATPPADGALGRMMRSQLKRRRKALSDMGAAQPDPMADTMAQPEQPAMQADPGTGADGLQAQGGHRMRWRRR